MGMLNAYMSSGPPFYPPPPPSQPPEDPPRREPFQDYFTPQPPPRQASPRSNGGLLGGLAAGAAVLFKFGVFKTLLTLLLSFGVYWAVIGPWAAAGLVAMILVHEMGHVIEIRRQGMLAVVSKWFQIVGLALLVLAFLVLPQVGVPLNPIVLIIVLMGLPAIMERFRNDKLPYYQSVPISARYAMGAAWLLLVG